MMGVWTALFSVTDEKNLVSTTECNMPDATSEADAVLFAQQMSLLIDALTTGYISRIAISKSVDLPATLAKQAAAGSDVEEGGRFQYRTENGFFSAMRLATLDEAVIVAGSQDVDLANADVTAYTTAMVSGIDLTGVGGSVVQPCDKRGEDLIALDTAREQFLASRRRQ